MLYFRNPPSWSWVVLVTIAWTRLLYDIVGPPPSTACCPWCGIPASEGSSCSLILYKVLLLYYFPTNNKCNGYQKSFYEGEEKVDICWKSASVAVVSGNVSVILRCSCSPLLNINRRASKGICFVKEEGGWCCCCWILILLQVQVNWRGDFNARNLITYHTPSSSSLVFSSGHISGVQFKHHHPPEWLFNNTLSFNIVTLKHKLIHGWILLEKKRISPVTVIIFLSAETARYSSPRTGSDEEWY